MIGFSGPRFGSQGGGGGDPISNPDVAYIQTNGNDSTAELGNPAKPFLTVAAALAAGSGFRSLEFGRGTFNGDAICAADFSGFIRGQGPLSTIIIGAWVGANGANGTLGEPGVSGESMLWGQLIMSDGSCTINLSYTGGQGGQGGTTPEGEGSGQPGGDGGGILGINLRGVVGSVSMVPGSGGPGGNGDPIGDQGADGLVDVSSAHFCILTTSGMAMFEGVLMSILNESAFIEI